MSGEARRGRARLPLVLALCAAVVAVTTIWLVHGGRADHDAADTRSADTQAAGGDPTHPSELYASDGTTLIARFDTDPAQACLRVPTNDWGFFCSYLVAWWLDQPAFGAQPQQRSDRLRHGGYRIVASLHLSLQAAAKRHVEEQLPTGDQRSLSVVSIEPGSGRVEAIAVNRNFRPATSTPSIGEPDGSSRNLLPDAEFPDTTAPLATGGGQAFGAQAGSTFMLFTAAAAVEQGIPLNFPIDTKSKYESRYLIAPNSPAACDGGHWCPTNTGDPGYRSGRRTMWDALSHSVVTYFVPLEERVGAQNVVDLARRLGIRFLSPMDAQLAMNAQQWGAVTIGVADTTTLDLANAYATLAADGTHCDPLPVRQITDPDGNPVPAAQPHCGPVLRPEVARAAMDAARCPVGDQSAFGDVCGAGTAPGAAIRGLVGRPVAGQVGAVDATLSAATVLASPQLATAAIATQGQCPSCRFGGRETTEVTNVVAGTQHDGLAPLPSVDFPAPPRQLALGR